ncbi:MAG: SpoIIIAH-like family protein [Firmicutes bacterium]|nr:SpoIIIAH-like family protein [Bacillota bacterium]MDY5855979.1 SpoIIIAH-like family protein [Anaerovoracaceae bacterium]
MENKKKKFTYRDILFRKRRVAAAMLIVVFGAGIILTQTGRTEIPVHDGDVLVDSLSVAEEQDVNLTSEGSFEERRAALELSRNKLIAKLDDTISKSSSREEQSNAAKEKERIMDAMETELAIESLIETKNLPDSFVLITETSVNVTVDKQELDTNTVAKICDIVMRETGRSADKIIIQSMY